MTRTAASPLGVVALGMALGMATALLVSCTTPAGGETAASASPDASESASESPVEGSGSEDADVADSDVPSGRIDAAAAVDAAVAAVPGDVVELGLGRERLTIVWEVGVLGADGSGTELYLDSQSGEVIRQEALRLDSAQRTAPTVTATEAIALALESADGRVKGMDLETDRSTLVWEVDVVGTSGSREVTIDATTGELVRVDR